MPQQERGPAASRGSLVVLLTEEAPDTDNDLANPPVVQQGEPVPPEDALEIEIQRKAMILNYVLKSTMAVVLYPFEYARTLMQVGYEPVEPVKGLTLFRRPSLLLPNFFQYIKYIKNVDGFFGCFRGIVPHLISKGTHMTIYSHVTYWVIDHVAKPGVPNTPYGRAKRLNATGSGDACFMEDDDDDEMVGEFRTYLRDMALDLISRCIAVTVSYPIHLVAIHSMVGFVGREPALCKGISGICKEIWKTQGLSGFFQGLIPRLVGEVLGAGSIGLFTYAIKIRVSNEELRSCLRVSLSLLTTSCTQMFNVVSSTMALNGGISAVGRPPFNPIFSDWSDCWDYLSDMNQLRRGGNFCYRHYTGPTTVINGQIRPTVIFFGPNFLYRQVSGFKFY